MVKLLTNLLTLIVIAIVYLPPTFAKSIIVQSSTSLKNSGFYQHVIPVIKNEIGIDLHVVAVGTGQAIKNALNCDGDLLITHAKEAELAFLKTGFGLKRLELMYSHWLIIGPEDTANSLTVKNDISDAFYLIFSKRHKFVSRGDNSGTHMREIKLWKKAGLNPKTFSTKWYLEVGSGQGATLNTSIQLEAFSLTDSATWFSFQNKGNAQIAYKDEKNFNVYSLTTINSKKCPNIKLNESEEVVDFLTSKRGKALISSFSINGELVFFPL